MLRLETDVRYKEILWHAKFWQLYRGDFFVSLSLIPNATELLVLTPQRIGKKV